MTDAANRLQTATYAKIKANNELDTTSAVLNFLFGHLKEYFAVMTFLLCYGRIGLTDFFAAPAILFFVLMAYAGPVLNPVLFLAFRLGPNLNTEGGSQNVPNYLKTLLSCIAIPLFQLFGIMSAAGIKKSLMDKYGTESRVTGTGSGAYSMLLKSPNHTYSGCNTSTAYPYELHNACTEDSFATWFYAEEWAASFLFCWIMYYIFEHGEYLIKKDNEDKKEGGVDNPFCTPGVVHASLISLLLVGMNYGFPTAHHGVHVTLYWWFLQTWSDVQFFTTGELTGRLIGGFLGGLTALIFFWGTEFIGNMDNVKIEKDKSSMFSSKNNTWLYAKIDQRQRV